MLNRHTTLLALLLNVLSLPAGAGETHHPALGTFHLVSEVVEDGHRGDPAAQTLIRTYRLANGDEVVLIHSIRPDGMLELDASRQSQQTLSSLDAYCATIGGTAVRTGVSHFPKAVQTLLSCGGSGPRPRRLQNATSASQPRIQSAAP